MLQEVQELIRLSLTDSTWMAWLMSISCATTQNNQWLITFYQRKICKLAFTLLATTNCILQFIPNTANAIMKLKTFIKENKKSH